MDYIIVHGYSCSFTSSYITCIIVTWVVCWIFPLLDMRAVDMRYVESHIYCSRSIVPVILFLLYCSRFPLYCSMLSTELRSCYHVTYIMYCICSCYIVYFKYQIIKITWVWGRLDGWLDLIGWMYWIHIVCPTAGDGVVLATICYSWAPVIILAHWDSRYMLQP